jgi:hypothetical protein
MTMKRAGAHRLGNPPWSVPEFNRRSDGSGSGLFPALVRRRSWEEEAGLTVDRDPRMHGGQK